MVTDDDVDVGYLYLLQRNLVAEHTEIYRNVAGGDTFFETTRRQILRQFGDTLSDNSTTHLFLVRHLKGFMDTEILAKTL